MKLICRHHHSQCWQCHFQSFRSKVISLSNDLMMYINRILLKSTIVCIAISLVMLLICFFLCLLLELFIHSYFLAVSTTTFITGTSFWPCGCHCNASSATKDFLKFIAVCLCSKYVEKVKFRCSCFLFTVLYSNSL